MEVEHAYISLRVQTKVTLYLAKIVENSLEKGLEQKAEVKGSL